MNRLRLLIDRSASSTMAGILLLLPALVACDHSAPPQPGPELSGRPVQTTHSQVRHEPAKLRLPGVTRAIERSHLAFLHSGHLAERHVRRGQNVDAGDPLAVLHNPALMPGVSSAEARVREIGRQLEQLERETRRLENLHERGLVATENLDRVRSRRDALHESRQQALSRLDEAREQLAEATLRAPFSGRIVDFHAEPGQFVAAGQPIISLSEPRRLEVELRVPARIATHLELADPVRLHRLDAELSIRATITEIGPAAPGQPAAVVVTLPENSNDMWQPGQPVHAELGWRGQTAVRVPLAALNDTATGTTRVFRVRDGIAQAVVVQPGRLQDGWVIVEGDLDAGEEVVITGHGRLLDGEPVRVVP